MRADQQRVVLRMRVGAADEMIELQRPQQSFHIRSWVAGMFPQYACQIGWTRPTLILVLDVRHDAQCLAEIFLVNTLPALRSSYTVEAGHRNGLCVLHAEHFRGCSRHAESCGQA